ncbi:uncharacterized protein LOC102809057, partial [Saccoglossus kowalevskii]|uniref:Uncharacterized protein LOC102809057 n=1 Tax=Saccoglossus kowalevskii TaxID=10224 RepID=A0ABM0MNE5_SACKO
DSTKAIESAYTDAVASAMKVKPQSDSTEPIKSAHTEDIASTMEEKQQPKSDSSEVIKSAHTDAVDSTTSQQETEDAVSNRSSENSDSTKPVPQGSSKFKNIEDTARTERVEKNINKLMERLKDVKDPEKKDFCFTLFDFGGQEIYYISHQVFMHGKFLYIIVTDISKELDEPVTDQKGQMKIHHELKTARDFILYWANTILTYATHSEDNKYPKIVVVATKADKISKKEAITRLHEINTFLSDVLSQKLAVKIAALYAINNKVPEVVYSIDGGDEESGTMSLLKDKLEDILTSDWFKYEVKCKWLEFELQLKATVADTKRPIKTIKEARKLAHEMSMNEEDCNKALEFYYRIGEMIGLEEEVGIKPEWFAELFRIVITCALDKFRRAGQTCFLKPLQEHGKLKEELLDCVFETNKRQEDKNILIELFKKFDIICEVNQSQPAQPGKQEFIMPCMLTSNASTIQDKPNTTTSPPLHYHFPDNFLPSAVFHQLVVRCISVLQSQSKQPCQSYPPELSKHAARYYWNASTIITLKKEDSDIALTVTFEDLDDDDDDDEDDDEDDEISNQSRCGPEIRKFVDGNLNEIIKKYRPGLSYEYSLKCPCGEHDLSNIKEDDGCVLIGSSKEVECCCNNKYRCNKGKLQKFPDLSFWFDSTDPSNGKSSYSATGASCIGTSSRRPDGGGHTLYKPPTPSCPLARPPTSQGSPRGTGLNNLPSSLSSDVGFDSLLADPQAFPELRGGSSFASDTVGTSGGP